MKQYSKLTVGGLNMNVDELNLTTTEREALKIAVTTIWLNDNSDYLNGLWDIIHTIIDDNSQEYEIDDLMKNFLGEDE